MANNVATTVATDEIAGVQYQKIKIADGTEDSTAMIPGDATYGLKVDVSRVATITPGTAATSLGKAEDAAAGDGDTGVAVLAVRRDSASSGVSADGDYANLSVDANGALRVTFTGGSSTVQYTEDAASAGGESLCLAGAVRQDTLSSSVSADGDYGTLKLDSAGRLWTSAKIDTALPAGSNVIGAVTQSGTWNVTSLMQWNGTTIDTNSGNKSAGTLRVVLATDQPALTNAQPVYLNANAAGGYTKAKYLSQTTTVQTVKGSAGKLGGWFIYNPGASAVYVQLFDTAGAVTLGTTAPDLVLGIPAGAAANLEIATGIDFASGIKFAITTGESNSTAPGSGCTVALWYK